MKKRKKQKRNTKAASNPAWVEAISAQAQEYVGSLFVFDMVDMENLRERDRAKEMVYTSLLRAERDRPETEPSYLFEEGESLIFPAAGLRGGGSDWVESELCGILMTNKRLFLMTNAQAFKGKWDIFYSDRGANREAQKYGVSFVQQVPLNKVRRIEVTGAKPTAPNGTIIVEFELSDHLLSVTGAMVQRAAEQKRPGYWDVITSLSSKTVVYELVIRSPRARTALMGLMQMVVIPFGKEVGLEVVCPDEERANEQPSAIFD